MKGDQSRLQLRVKKLGNYIIMITYLPKFVKLLNNFLVKFKYHSCNHTNKISSGAKTFRENNKPTQSVGFCSKIFPEMDSLQPLTRMGNPSFTVVDARLTTKFCLTNKISSGAKTFRENKKPTQ